MTVQSYFTLCRLQRYLDQKIRVCGKDSIPLEENKIKKGLNQSEIDQTFAEDYKKNNEKGQIRDVRLEIVNYVRLELKCFYLMFN